ncbi:hypothetical protein CFK37_19505 [Virgibacillus phasianinus]|uniref:Uncharacterized protein n=2 Tax=Virgibacillus phasianinus TaxID=2017483 RepID=A0A220U7R8_9BACI|nr:hypothetical protein CFK37_19505 [Virgibacillus phasianinus]
MIFLSFKDITEKGIEKNIGFLKQEEWFQAYVNNEKHNKLIANNTRVRKEIGNINIEKMSKTKYYKRQQKRVENLINKKSLAT